MERTHFFTPTHWSLSEPVSSIMSASSTTNTLRSFAAKTGSVVPAILCDEVQSFIVPGVPITTCAVTLTPLSRVPGAARALVIGMSADIWLVTSKIWRANSRDGATQMH